MIGRVLYGFASFNGMFMESVTHLALAFIAQFLWVVHRYLVVFHVACVRQPQERVSFVVVEAVLALRTWTFGDEPRNLLICVCHVELHVVETCRRRYYLIGENFLTFFAWNTESVIRQLLRVSTPVLQMVRVLRRQDTAFITRFKKASVSDSIVGLHDTIVLHLAISLEESMFIIDGWCASSNIFGSLI